MKTDGAIPSIERKAVTEIDMSCHQVEERIAIAGLTSDAARLFVEQPPSTETLMPRLSFATIAGEAEPPVAEQLISPNAFRERRYREQQAALCRNASEAQALARNGDEAPGAGDDTDDLGIPTFLHRTKGNAP
jgi:hypothetical protein